MIQLSNMTKEKFYETHLKGRYFKVNSKEIENVVKPMAKALNKRFYPFAGVVTFDPELPSKWLLSPTIPGEEGSIWVVKGVFDLEVSAMPSEAPIEVGTLVKLSNGNIAMVISDKVAICSSKERDLAYNVNNYFRSQIVEVRKVTFDSIGSTIEETFEKGEVVWSLYDKSPKTPEKPRIFLAISYEAPKEFVETVKESIVNSGCQLVTWSNDLSPAKNNKVIQRCKGLVVVPPADFLERRVVGKGIAGEIKQFLKTNDKKDILILAPSFEDDDVVSFGLSEVRVFEQPENYQNYATLITYNIEDEE